MVVGREVLPTGTLPEKGRLVYDGEGKIQCHICGHWYKDLASHVRQTHNIMAKEYREIYELNRTQPLCSPEKSNKLARILRNTGLVGKINRGTQGLKDYRGQGHAMRTQGRNNLSKDSMGKKQPSPMSARRAKSQRANLLRCFSERPCGLCGLPVLASKSRSNAYCPSCRKQAKRLYMQVWGKTHAEHRREYMRQWYLDHPGYRDRDKRSKL